MKPPYLAITAVCDRHGAFKLHRKPRPQIRTSSGTIQSLYYEAVTCPTCRMWAKPSEQVLVTGTEEEK